MLSQEVARDASHDSVVPRFSTKGKSANWLVLGMTSVSESAGP